MKVQNKNFQITMTKSNNKNYREKTENKLYYTKIDQY